MAETNSIEALGRAVNIVEALTVVVREQPEEKRAFAPELAAAARTALAQVEVVVAELESSIPKLCQGCYMKWRQTNGSHSRPAGGLVVCTAKVARAALAPFTDHQRMKCTWPQGCGS